MAEANKVCPECGHEFKGNGWDGIDGHWRTKHAHIMRYEEAWPLISAGTYKLKRKAREDVSLSAAEIVREATQSLIDDRKL